MLGSHQRKGLPIIFQGTPLTSKEAENLILRLHEVAFASSTLSSLDRTDTQRGVLPGVEPKSAICVQRFDDSLNSAIRITYRISLRSSSLREPRHPLLRVVLYVYLTIHMK